MIELERHRYPSGLLPEGERGEPQENRMFQHRQILVRLRQGDTEREIARRGLGD